MRGPSSRLASAAAFAVVTVFACSDGQEAPASPSGDGGPPSSSGSASGLVTVTEETMDFGGKPRRYLLATPNTYDASKSYPLVLSFHGNPGSAEGQAEGLPFDSASKADAVIAYPDADTDSWDLYTPTDANADMGFIRALPEEIAAKLNIDRDHVFGYGYSGGAFFLTQLTCRFGDVFKAISINAGGGPDEQQMGYGKHENGCYVCPGGPVATIVTHGDSDKEVDPSSGEFTHGCYATFNGCGDGLSPTTPAPCRQHDGCPADKPVKWCLVPGQGHGPWGDSMRAAWAFFSALP